MADKVEIHKARDVFHGEHKLADDDYPVIQNAVAETGVVNPLTLISSDQMLRDVDQFVDEYGLSEHRDLFKRGALVARDPMSRETLMALPDDEKEALVYETNHKWAGSWGLWYTVFICATGAATQGWDQTGSNGANLSFPQEFGLADDSERSFWIVGLINSIPYLAAGLVGCWLSDPLNHYFGRRGEIFITGVFLIATPIGSGFAQNWYQLFIIRFLMGVAFGAKNSTVPIFSAEIAPARVRGGLVMGWQLWVCFGIFLGFAANVVVKDVPNIAWRLQLGSAFIPAVPLVAGIWFCPESPKWLMKKGRYAAAFNSYIRLRKHPLQAARDMYYSHVLFIEEKAMAAGTTYWSRNVDCWKIPRLRRASLAACTVMIAQQMCGINIISFYSSTVFVEGGASQDNALFASLGFGAVNFVFAIPAVWLIDSFGRRSLLLSTFPFMTIFLLCTGLSFLAPVEGDVRLALTATFIYLFTAFYSVGEGPVAFAYSAEVSDNIHRESAMCQAVSVNNTFAGILGLTFPKLLDAFSPIGAFGFYAGINTLALVWIFLYVRETRKLTLEELDQVFAVPVKDFVGYQTGHWTPRMFRRYIMRDRAITVTPFLAHMHEKGLAPVA
ncbi:hypothetical protein FFLO_03270 [Filobasidium floriforme]|uniref:Major facilitator superfamily (MFS) profile domain-containing protein n=1 Tax=Filobasidium floriforme TaxID=5210 RepID=A0A8K0NT94_9TREE|nr:uncharacterized protein HD553DRAFT_319530 [Filobasidium floriforme]KAG7544309.1 hypothetical protein FFLO_03270 [Filobasidium floriforme]KAH8078661.1 hypothetical protein HD553DRAFT_319530 [Filobasidium floriforme]